MRAAVQSRYGGPEAVTITDREVPQPGRGEVLLRVEAAAVDAGTVHLLEGRPSFIRLMMPLRGGRVIGGDVAGVVEAVGDGVHDLAVGDAVFGVAHGSGSLAERTVAAADRVVRRPDALTAAEAAALPISGSAAWRAVRAAGVSAGARVLVCGAGGGVGHLAVQIAKAEGAHVTAVCSAAKAHIAGEAGADAIVDYAAEDALARGPFDAILDAGGHRPVSAMRRALVPGGALVIIGSEPESAAMGGFGRSIGAGLINPFVGHRLIMLTSKEDRESLEALAALAESGAVRPVITRELPLEEAAEALRGLGRGRGAGKTVVRM
ncbi:NAD(P)-dependent alcohol dehydrogenase [Microbacterium halophytorum]|uniref:NAD(P)-dependent alcohol dehydrogenase n=1 Tax=Microbacterium halophytorum TaxID=2067568 RepID=UPI00131A291C|nr:NAD(P)-dependent alcohol dehydrogenase [Microbacterium halophytorum]